MLKDILKQQVIGETIFTRSRNIEKLLDISKIYLKFEGGNPTGTMKDRASYACLKLARRQGYKKVVIASCGNFGASFVHLAKDFDMEVHVYIPEAYHTPRIQEMRREGGVLHRAPGTYEDLVELAGRGAEENGWFNANPGAGENTATSLEAYAAISQEIFEDLGSAPDVVAVPVGNGTTLAGVYKGFKELREVDAAYRVPVMVAASTSGGNPVIKCFQEGKRVIEDLDPGEILETEHNEPLVSWRSLDGQEALDAIWDSSGWATYIKDEELLEFSEILAREEGILVLPASTASLAALARYARGVRKTGTYVAVLTGRNHIDPRRL